MRSGPAAAYAPTVARVTPPDTSVRIGPAASRCATVIGLGDRRGVHVVEQHRIGACLSRLGHLVERVALDLDEPSRPARLCCVHGVGDAHAGEMVVFDQHRVGEPGAVVGATPGADGRLFQHTEPRHGLARVEDLHGAVAHVSGLDELRREGRHAGEVTEKFSAVRSAVRMGRSGPVTSMSVSPVTSTSPSSARHVDIELGPDTRGRSRRRRHGRPARRADGPAARSAP